MNKKLLLSFTFFLISFLVHAQKFTNKEKALIFNRVDTLLTSYMEKSTLTEPGSIRYNDKITTELKKLFLPDAKIFDDINARFDPVAKGYPYKLETKNRDDYFDDIAEEFASGLSVNVKNINISYNKLDSGIIEVALEREISGITKTNEYSFANNDTIILIIAVNAGEKSVKIKSIRPFGNPQVIVTNDKDLDGVIDSKDECADAKGKWTLAGCPDRDDDNIPDDKDECDDAKGPPSNKGCPLDTWVSTTVVSGAVGWQLNLNSIAKKMPDDGYKYKPFDNRDYSEHYTSDKLSEVNNPGFKGALTLMGNLSYYFGRKKNNKKIGLSFGFLTTRFINEYKVTGLKHFYKATDKEGLNYWRLVTVNSASEKITYSLLDFPLQLKFRTRVKKVGIEISGGPSFYTLISNSEFEADVDYEGIYPSDGKSLTFDETKYVPSKKDFVIVSDSIIDTQGNPDNFYALLKTKDYLFGHEALGGSSKPKTRTGIAFNGGLDIMYLFNTNLAFKVGFNFMLARTSNNKAETYSYADNDDNGNVNNRFNSLYDSKIKSTYTAFGFSAGVIFGVKL